MSNPYKKYLESLGEAQQQTGDLFGQMLSGTQGSRQDISDRYALMRQNLGQMSETASGQAAQGYAAARERVQAAPEAYVRPAAPARQIGAVPAVGADAATVANLRAAAQQGVDANQAALRQVYDTLAQSDVANRRSRLSDIDLASTSDLAQLAALAQAQTFGLGRQEMADLTAIDQVINQIQRDQIAADLGYGERELSAITQGQTFDQNAMNSAVNMFTAMVNPIVDVLEPDSLLELWLAFSEEIGMPMQQALGSVGAV